MLEIGVRELKIKASEIVRNVWKRRAHYLLTYRGRPVGLIVPLEALESRDIFLSSEPAQAIWDELTRLGKKISQGWPEGVTSAEVLSEMRR